MTMRYVDTSDEFNPFRGRNRDEVWEELNKLPKKHVDKDKILAEMRSELIKRKLAKEQELLK